MDAAFATDTATTSEHGDGHFSVLLKASKSENSNCVLQHKEETARKEFACQHRYTALCDRTDVPQALLTDLVIQDVTISLFKLSSGKADPGEVIVHAHDEELYTFTYLKHILHTQHISCSTV